MPTKLKLKPTQSDIDSILHKESKARKKRRKEEARTRTNDSVTPPRNPPPPPTTSTSDSTNAKPKKPTFLAPEDMDMGFDESALPPEQAYKRTRDMDELEDQERFNDRLRDELEADSGIGYYEDLLYSREASRVSASFSYGGAAGLAMGVKNGMSGLEAMDEEEYAEHIRANMWRRKNKDEVERIERIRKEKEDKTRKEEEELERLRRKERERIRKLEENARRRNDKSAKEARALYDEKWRKLLSPPSSSSSSPLRFTDFPWPIFPPAPLPPLSWPSPSDITPSTVSLFLLSSVPAEDKKKVLRSAVLNYHPDRFERLVGRLPEEKGKEEDGEKGNGVRERTRELGLRVSQVLNDLMKGAGAGN